jgi:hypothetical protein
VCGCIYRGLRASLNRTEFSFLILIFDTLAFRRALRIWLLAESVGRYLVKAVSLLSAASGFSCVLIRRQLDSLFSFSALVVLERLVPDSVVFRLQLPTPMIVLMRETLSRY